SVRSELPLRRGAAAALLRGDGLGPPGGLGDQEAHRTARAIDPRISNYPNRSARRAAVEGVPGDPDRRADVYRQHDAADGRTEMTPLNGAGISSARAGPADSSGPADESRDELVLVLAPTGRDVQLTCALL